MTKNNLRILVTYLVSNGPKFDFAPLLESGNLTTLNFKTGINEGVARTLERNSTAP